ncbi:DNA (cytosine-5)-methyltransferase CMT1 [Lolium perenne]|uniref:DNA (cytosine-5)-methyltransferase CMT1 n=1 Tax=Lolium perenne TaxID=4522 RepID=UPI003A993E5A
MSPVTPSRATDPSRSARLRPKPADADADLGRGTSRSARLQPKPADAELGRGKRQRKAATATDDDGQPVGAGVADADAEQERGASRSRGKRQRKAAGKADAGTRGRGSAAKDDDPEEAAQAPVGEAPRTMDADGAISDDICADEPDAEELRMGDDDEEASDGVAAGGGDGSGAGKKRVARPSAKRTSKAATPDHFVGEPIPDGEARQRWPERYAAKVPKGSDSKAKRSDAEEEIRALRHYTTVCVDDANFHLGDDVYVKAAPGVDDYIGRITELFEGSDHGSHFTCRWFFRVEDTVISPSLLEVNDHKHDPKRVFFSEEKNDNLIESIISKVNIIYVGPNVSAPFMLSSS